MRRTFWLLVAISTVVALAGCHHLSTMEIGRGPIDVHKKLPYPMFMCMGLTCDQMVYVDNCGFETADGTAITTLELHRGQRICFENVSDCDITIKYSTDLFAETHPYVTIYPEDCTNMTVTSTATDADCTVELVCACGAMSDGHSNPDVVIGDD